MLPNVNTGFSSERTFFLNSHDNLSFKMVDHTFKCVFDEGSGLDGGVMFMG
ncbi:MAG: hypothetical protein KDD45_14205 [Bdellovibrionales bacterium]|nr:hypothetical protein [Bdellovibrionales bacterium]